MPVGSGVPSLRTCRGLLGGMQVVVGEGGALAFGDRAPGGVAMFLIGMPAISAPLQSERDRSDASRTHRSDALCDSDLRLTGDIASSFRRRTAIADASRLSPTAAD